ncbi:Gfo/Idh/MocA family protein [Crocosphaera watsonii]|uniref:Oxidoreductase, Gfo/Idh/MocA family/transferase hexapeptide repeat protein n=3 Tax=Crocosphaera watsonii TaxID=263511 RepID=T2JK93_CROWT|nr:Gfo/Idh/MocA family oxidoreductase [Crocosphaera watsonii]EHJ11761.1 oxidoreductase domain protein [Crocosphaera watsonii WH 0003]CCQ54429.1 oxidoreductase, Gfo/Idh/MocA family/transferase hexapeptide repeat protein [Crocosphaera watsonii WH 0005]CCQ65541.1 oxidoreductase, Gfo/Idh/MocA family/transferase hexapeptide repeat protein [Crocosphaera watsonii WH 0402]
MSQVIVVGAGNWGKNLIRNFYELDALAAVVELNDELRSKVETDYPNLTTYKDYQEALNTDVSAFVLATPAPTHYALAKAALEAGKDVFVEKPMTLKGSQARQLAEYADSQSRILMVGHLLLYQPAVDWMANYLKTGKAGKVFHVSTQRAKLGQVRREENVWWSFAPHDVSVVLALLGNPTVEEVKARGHAMLQTGIEDNVHVDLRFVGGQTAHLHSSWYWPLLERRTIVMAEKQMLVYDEVSQKVTIYNKGVDNNLANRDEGSEEVTVANEAPLRLECQHFLDCIKSRQTPRSDGWNGVAVVDILEKAEKALND